MRNRNHPPATSGVITSLLLALLGLVMPLQASMVTGNFDGNTTLTPTGTPGVYTQSFIGDGTDATYGAFDAQSTSTADFSHPPSITLTNGMLLETFTNGTLFGTGSGSGMGNGHGEATFTIDFLITGGTGIFAGDTGQVIVNGTIIQTGPTTEAINATYAGQIIPEPSTLVLLAASLAGLALWRLRGLPT